MSPYQRIRLTHIHPPSGFNDTKSDAEITQAETAEDMDDFTQSILSTIRQMKGTADWKDPPPATLSTISTGNRMLLLSTVIGFEGDPNSLSAPSILQIAVVGTWYFRESTQRYYKRHSTRWVPEEERVFLEGVDIYVNPVTGNDGNPGDSTRPIATLAEVFNRIPVSAGGMSVYLSGHQHKIRDVHGTGSSVVDAAVQLKPKFYGQHDTLTFIGETSIHTTLNVTGVTDNVLTVTDTLVVDELRGKFLYSNSGSRARWIKSNTTNTVTVAAVVATLGGTDSLPTGSVDVIQLDSEIVPPDTNASNLRNRFFFTGAMNFDFVHFNGLGTGRNAVEGISIGRSKSAFSTCKFSNWLGAGIYAPTVSVSQCYFDEIGTLALWIGAYASVNGPNVFRNCRYCMGANAPGGQGDTGNFTMTSGFSAWVDSCGAVFGTTIYDVVDTGYGYWLDDIAGRWALESFMRVDNPLAHYTKALRPMRQLGGTANWPSFFNCAKGNIMADFQDSGNANIGTALLFTDTVNSISLANFVAGNPPSTSIKHFRTPRGCSIYDSDVAPEAI